MDLVIPNKNEKKFIEMALKIGFSSICFYYSQKVETFSDEKIKIFTCVPLNSKEKADFYLFDRDKDLRGQLKLKKKLLITGIEAHSRADYIHQRNAGLNNVIAKEMKEKGAIYAIDFGSIISLKGRKRARVLGRMMQNIKLMRKYGITTLIVTNAKSPLQMRSMKDMDIFMKILGASSEQIKKSSY